MTLPPSFFRSTLAAGLLLLGAKIGSAAVLTFEATGNAAAIQGQVDAFRVQLGTLNAPGACSPSPCLSGRREVNWDAVPNASFNPFPGGFFNNDGTLAGRTRGLILSPASGSHFEIDTDTNQFGFPGNFPSFSSPLIFAIVGLDTNFDITFAVPGQPTSSAFTRGFGIVFTDVELANTTSMQFFDTNGTLVHTQFALSNSVSGSFSFAGASFTTEQIARVRVKTGSGGFCIGTDCVAMDDFIYGEPQTTIPEPTTILLSLACLVTMAIKRRF